MKILFALTQHKRFVNGEETTGCYLTEVATPYYLLKKAGVDVDFISPNGGEIPIKLGKKTDLLVDKFLADKNIMARFQASYSPSHINPADYRGIFYPGGHGVLWDLAQNKEIAAIAASIHENNGVIAAVCHGVAGLLPIISPMGTPLIQGKKITSFSNKEELALGMQNQLPYLLETALREKGANYSSIGNFQEYTLIDQRIITGQNPTADISVTKELINIIHSF